MCTWKLRNSWKTNNKGTQNKKILINLLAESDVNFTDDRTDIQHPQAEYVEKIIKSFLLSVHVIPSTYQKHQYSSARVKLFSWEGFQQSNREYQGKSKVNWLKLSKRHLPKSPFLQCRHNYPSFSQALKRKQNHLINFFPNKEMLESKIKLTIWKVLS